MEEFDVVIVGAGLSGIGAAAHLQERFPKRRYVILEARAAIGGTLRETAAERGIDRHIRFGHRVQRAEWSGSAGNSRCSVMDTRCASPAASCGCAAATTAMRRATGPSSRAVPRRDATVRERPYLDFTSGYVQRALPMLPKQGDRRPWRLYQNYLLDLLTLRYGRLDDGVMKFRGAPDKKPGFEWQPGLGSEFSGKSEE